MAARKKKRKKTKRKATHMVTRGTAHALARTKRRKKGATGPTKFQRFLMRDPEAAKRKMGW